MAKKKRTSIRTAAGTTQERLKAQLAGLVDDPTRVLPSFVGPPPTPLARIQARLERMKKKGPGLLDRRDRGIVGAVAQSMPLAELEKIPRVADVSVGGQRRFFLMRGQVDRSCMVGVQNHDAPQALLMAYRALAKKHGLHFFAGSTLWCTGTTGVPPAAWFDDLPGSTDLKLHAVGDDRVCLHEGARVELRLAGGAAVAVCGPCGATAGNLHRRMAARYAGPKERQPFEVTVRLPDGTHGVPDAEDAAGYRGGVKTEADLIRSAMAAWRKEQRGSGKRYVLGEQDHGTDQKAFLDALGATGAERIALAALTKDGHVGAETNLVDVIEAYRNEIGRGVAAILDDADEFLQQHERLLAPKARNGLRELLREAGDEAERRRTLAALPRLKLDQVGALIDRVVRAHRLDDRRGALDEIRKAMQDTPPAHLAACLRLVGTDMNLWSRLDAGAQEAGTEWAQWLEPLVEAKGEAYHQALERYLRETGSGETAHLA